MRDVAELLAEVIRTIDADLVICGERSSDTGGGGLPGTLAAILDLPCVGTSRNVRVSSTTVHAWRALNDGGAEEVEADLPAVVAISDDDWDPPRPRALDMLAARDRRPERMTRSELALDVTERHGDWSAAPAILAIKERPRACEFIEGDTPARIATELLRRLRTEAR
jgi:electron transfer flavoprotein beta subunit